MTRIACFAALLAAGASHAHHSPAAYDVTKEITVEGMVAAVEWKNPHIYFTLRVASTTGASVVSVEADGIAAAQTSGLTRDVLADGARVTVRGAPSRRDAAQMLGIDVATADGAIYPLGPRGRSTAATATPAASGLAGRWAPKPANFGALIAATQAWPFTAAARAARADVATTLAAAGGCAPAYPQPLLMGLHALHTIDVTADAVRIRIDGIDGAERTVRLDIESHPANVEPSLLGHSIGRWEGETLVIDTVGFAPHRQGIAFGVPSSARKHLTEKLTLSADRRQIRYEFTLRDPEHLEAPVSFVMPWEHRPDLEPSAACDHDVARRFLAEAATAP